MAFYYLRVEGIKASSSASLIGGAAYIAGQRLGDPAKIYDFKAKEGVRDSGLVLPQNSPNFDRPGLWAAVESLRSDVAKMGSATLISRSFKIILPLELPKEAQNAAVHDFVAAMAAEGWPCDWAFHEGKDNKNQHGHVNVPNMDVLILNENGFQLKQRQKTKVYANALDHDGKPIFDPSKPAYDPKTKANAECRIPVLDKNGNQKFRERPGKGKEFQWYRVYADSQAQENSRERLDHWRKLWEDACNKQLQKYNLQNINSKSRLQQFKDGDIAVPLKSKCHIGRKASALHRKGIMTRRHIFNAKVEEHNKKLLNDYRKKIVPSNINISDQVFLLLCEDPVLRNLWFKMNRSQKGMFADLTYTLSITSYNIILDISKKVLDNSHERGVKQQGACMFTLKNLKKEELTFERCLEEVKKDYRELLYVPEDLLNQHEELSQVAFENDVFALETMPNKFKTQEMCDKAFSEAPQLFEFVPDKFKTVEMATKAIEYDGNLARYCPVSIMNEDLAIKAVASYPRVFDALPRDLKTAKVSNEMAIGAFLKANNTIINNHGTNYALPPDANCRLMVTLDKNYEGIVKAQFANTEGKFEKHDGVVAISTLDNDKVLTRDEVFSFVKQKIDELTSQKLEAKKRREQEQAQAQTTKRGFHR